MMQETLLIYLQHDLTCVNFAVFDTAGVLRVSGVDEDPEGLAAMTADKAVFVLVPTEDVLLRTVTLPKMNRARLHQALPFALEEHLIADVELLHFADGPREANGEIPVAIVDKNKMQAWYDFLLTWDIHPDAMLPACLAIPHAPLTWHIVIHEMADVRIGEYEGFACDNENMALLLNELLKKQSPTAIIIENFTSQTYQAMINFDQVVENFHQEKWLKQYAVPLSTFNLLQPPFALKKVKRINHERHWRNAAYLAGTWIALLFFIPIISNVILQHRVNVIDDEITAIYKKNFPQANSVVAPKVRMQDKLQKMNTMGGNNPVLLLLAEVGKALQGNINVKLLRFDYQNNQLTLQVNAANSEDFSTFTDALAQLGLSVRQQNATLVGNRINASLLIERNHE